MSKPFVADASVAIAWVHPAQATAETEAMLQAVADGAVVVVPALWPVEVANALTSLVRRKRLTADECAQALGWLRALPVRIDHEMAALALTKLAALASDHALSVYDAAYLELASRRKLPLACKDGPLRAAAKKAGVKLLP